MVRLLLSSVRSLVDYKTWTVKKYLITYKALLGYGCDPCETVFPSMCTGKALQRALSVVYTVFIVVKTLFHTVSNSNASLLYAHFDVLQKQMNF